MLGVVCQLTQPTDVQKAVLIASHQMRLFQDRILGLVTLQLNRLVHRSMVQLRVHEGPLVVLEHLQVELLVRDELDSVRSAPVDIKVLVYRSHLIHDLLILIQFECLDQGRV